MSAKSPQRSIESVVKQPLNNDSKDNHFGDLILREGIQNESVPADTCISTQSQIQTQDQIHKVSPSSPREIITLSSQQRFQGQDTREIQQGPPNIKVSLDTETLKNPKFDHKTIQKNNLKIRVQNDKFVPTDPDQKTEIVHQMQREDQKGTQSNNQDDKLQDFTKLFPKMNQQAIELVMQSNEPETALEILKEGLDLLERNRNSLRGSLAGENKNLRHSICSDPLKLKVTSTFVDSKLETSKNQNSKFGVSNSGALWKQSTATSNAKGGSQRGGAAVKGLIKDEHLSSSQRETPAYKSTGRQTMHKPYSLSNDVSLGQPSSSIKSSTLTNNPAKEVTPDRVTETDITSLLLEPPPLTQQVKKQTSISNFIVCLYYNMASCYQRLGLLEEAVEMLEMASDQLGDTIRFYSQEENVFSMKKRALLEKKREQQKSKNLQQVQNTTTIRSRPSNFKQSLDQTLKAALSHLNSHQPISKRVPLSAKSVSGSQKTNKFDYRTLNSPQTTKLITKNRPSPASGSISAVYGTRAIKKVGVKVQEEGNSKKIRRQSKDDSSCKQIDKMSMLRKFVNNNKVLHNSAEEIQIKDDDFQCNNTEMQMIQEQLSTKEIPQVSDICISQPVMVSKSSAENLSKLSEQAKKLEEITNLYSGCVGRLGAELTTKNPKDSSGRTYATVEWLIAEGMHKARYQCKMQLQICALMSQLERHRDALIYGRKAALICFQLIKKAQFLCKRFVQQIRRHAQEVKQNSDEFQQIKGNQTPKILEQAFASQRAAENDYQTGMILRKVQKAKKDCGRKTFEIRSKSLKQTQDLDSTIHKESDLGSTKSVFMGKKFRNERPNSTRNFGRVKSSCSQTSSNSNPSTSNQSVFTRLRLSKSKGDTLVHKSDQNGNRCESSTSKKSNYSCRASSIESLDRIHTFNLRSVVQQAGKQVQQQNLEDVRKQSVDESAEAACLKEVNQYPLKPKEDPQKTNYESYSNQSPQVAEKRLWVQNQSKIAIKIDELNQEQLIAKDKQTKEQKSNAIYIEEQVKVLQELIFRADPILQELSKVIKQFEDSNQKSAAQRDEELKVCFGLGESEARRKNLKISFQSQKELARIEQDQRFKINVRSSLGVKNSQDWIYGLNIGNVMHLNMMKEAELGSTVENTHELTKDTMLEKVVLIASAYFCIATEIRFILQSEDSLKLRESELINKDEAIPTAIISLDTGIDKLLDTDQSRFQMVEDIVCDSSSYGQKYKKQMQSNQRAATFKDSETFHAKALHLSLLFLPTECPLTQYIQQTYQRNFLKDKLIKQRKAEKLLFEKIKLKEMALKDLRPSSEFSQPYSVQKKFVQKKADLIVKPITNAKNIAELSAKKRFKLAPKTVLKNKYCSVLATKAHNKIASKKVTEQIQVRQNNGKKGDTGGSSERCEQPVQRRKYQSSEIKVLKKNIENKVTKISDHKQNQLRQQMQATFTDILIQNPKNEISPKSPQASKSNALQIQSEANVSEKVNLLKHPPFVTLRGQGKIGQSTNKAPMIFIHAHGTNNKLQKNSMKVNCQESNTSEYLRLVSSYVKSSKKGRNQPVSSTTSNAIQAIISQNIKNSDSKAQKVNFQKRPLTSAKGRPTISINPSVNYSGTGSQKIKSDRPWCNTLENQKTTKIKKANKNDLIAKQGFETGFYITGGKFGKSNIVSESQSKFQNPSAHKRAGTSLKSEISQKVQLNFLTGSKIQIEQQTIPQRQKNLSLDSQLEKALQIETCNQMKKNSSALGDKRDIMTAYLTNRDLKIKPT